MYGKGDYPHFEIDLSDMSTDAPKIKGRFRLPMCDVLRDTFFTGGRLMPVPRCDECEWWTPHTVIVERLAVGEASDPVDGACTRQGKARPLSGDSLHLETAPDYGCVQWEAKE